MRTADSIIKHGEDDENWFETGAGWAVQAFPHVVDIIGYAAGSAFEAGLVSVLGRAGTGTRLAAMAQKIVTAEKGLTTVGKIGVNAIPYAAIDAGVINPISNFEKQDFDLETMLLYGAIASAAVPLAAKGFSLIGASKRIAQAEAQAARGDIPNLDNFESGIAHSEDAAAHAEARAKANDPIANKSDDFGPKQELPDVTPVEKTEAQVLDEHLENWKKDSKKLRTEEPDMPKDRLKDLDEVDLEVKRGETLSEAYTSLRKCLGG
jgi:hypothetical protein